MLLPDRIRIGLWRNYGYHDPFRSTGWWVGPSLGNFMPGQNFHQDIEEGRLEFSVGILYRPDRGKREKVEIILKLKTIDKAITEAMWSYNTWEKVENDVDTEELSRDFGSVSEAVDPW